jgi:thiol-disulfide isomerase/thioredoxin
MDAMPARRNAVVLAAAVFSLLAAGCSGTHAVSQDVSGSNGYQVGDEALHFVAPSDRKPIGDVRGQLLDGSEVDLGALHGDVVVVNFWASWCAPCQAEATALEQVYRDDAGRGVRFLGVDIDDDRASAAAFVRAHHVTYPTVFDQADTIALDFRGLPPNATPTTIVLDRTGRIAARHSGSILYTQLRDVVNRVLAEPQT